MPQSNANTEFEYLAQIASEPPGVTAEPDDARSRATLTNPNGWTLTLTSTQLIFGRPDGAWATMDRKSNKLERQVRNFSRGNSMGIPWQERL